VYTPKIKTKENHQQRKDTEAKADNVGDHVREGDRYYIIISNLERKY
jgi:hypothetical protein